MSRHVDERGLTTVELLVAAALLVAVVGAALVLVAPLRGLVDAVGGSLEQTQRVRVGVAVLTEEVLNAGSGLVLPATHGAFGAVVPALLPDVLSLPRAGEGMPAAVGWRASTLTVLYVPHTAAQGRLGRPAGPSAPLTLDPAPHCPGPLSSCGFAPDDLVLVFDETGAWEIAAVSGVDDAGRRLMRTPGFFARAWPRGAIVTQLAIRTYGLRPDVSPGLFVLMRDEGSGVAQPVLDHVAAFDIEWYGDPRPPRVEALDHEGRAWTTYGPPPPRLEDPPAGAWAPGENCVFARDAGGAPVPRLEVLAAGTAPVPLDPARLQDGPWCPDALAPWRHDADLLRVRQLVVRLRVEAAAAALRPPAPLPPAGARAGILVPARTIRLGAAPRSLARER